MDRKLVAGSTDLLLLKLLEREDMYGYQMIEELRRRSNDVFDMKAGTRCIRSCTSSWSGATSRPTTWPPGRRGCASTIT